MSWRAVFAVMAAGVLSAAAYAGEATELRPGATVKFADRQPEGKVSGWALVSNGYMITLAVEKIEGADKKPGETFDVFARTRKVAGKDQAVESDVAALRGVSPGAKVEIAWFRAADKPRAAALTLLRPCPRAGTLAGKVLKRENTPLTVKVDRASAGAEDVIGQTLPFYFTYVPNPDKGDEKRRSIPSPEQVKLFGSLAEGDLVEVVYKADNRFRVDSLKVTAKAPAGEKPPESKEPAKNPPPPSTEKKPPPVTDNDF